MELKYTGEPDKVTQRIRSTLYFLQLIENKILKQQVHNQNFEGTDGFSKWMTLYLK